MKKNILEIYKTNIIHNLNLIKSHLDKDTKFCAVIKGNAYGTDLIQMANFLNEYVDFFAVSLAKDAILLRESGISKKILVLGSTPIEYMEDVLENKISVSVFSEEYLATVKELARKKNIKANIHIKYNTGLNRLGFKSKDEIINLAKQLKADENINIEGLYTHLARADEEDFEFNLMQLEKFDELVKELETLELRPEIVHAKNSSAAITQTDYEYDMIRAGGLIFGLVPNGENISSYDFRPTMSLKTHLAQIHCVEKGHSIGYGENYIAKRDMLIGVLPIGYADGYAKQLENRAHVLIDGEKYELVGSIAMDMCMVDLKDRSDFKIGKEVILLGNSEHESITVTDIAKMTNSIETEFVTNISSVIDRVYLD
ncbi:MAG: alanine racemase [Tissierellia bacterium]|nr:alanine racemase [Tissierellia bacterium]